MSYSPECPKCGETLPLDGSRCARCGWTLPLLSDEQMDEIRRYLGIGKASTTQREERLVKLLRDIRKRGEKKAMLCAVMDGVKCEECPERYTCDEAIILAAITAELGAEGSCQSGPIDEVTLASCRNRAQDIVWGPEGAGLTVGEVRQLLEREYGVAVCHAALAPEAELGERP